MCSLGVAGVELLGYFFGTIDIDGSRSSQCVCYVDTNVGMIYLKDKCGDACWAYGDDSGEITYSDGGDGTCYRKKLGGGNSEVKNGASSTAE